MRCFPMEPCQHRRDIEFLNFKPSFYQTEQNRIIVILHVLTTYNNFNVKFGNCLIKFEPTHWNPTTRARDRYSRLVRHLIDLLSSQVSRNRENLVKWCPWLCMPTLYALYEFDKFHLVTDNVLCCFQLLWYFCTQARFWLRFTWCAASRCCTAPWSTSASTCCRGSWRRAWASCCCWSPSSSATGTPASWASSAGIGFIVSNNKLLPSFHLVFGASTTFLRRTGKAGFTLSALWWPTI